MGLLASYTAPRVCTRDHAKFPSRMHGARRGAGHPAVERAPVGCGVHTCTRSSARSLAPKEQTNGRTRRMLLGAAPPNVHLVPPRKHIAVSAVFSSRYSRLMVAPDGIMSGLALMFIPFLCKAKWRRTLASTTRPAPIERWSVGPSSPRAPRLALTSARKLLHPCGVFCVGRAEARPGAPAQAADAHHLHSGMSTGSLAPIEQGQEAPRSSYAAPSRSVYP